MGTSQDKRAALDIALERLEKNHGKGAVMRLGEISQHLENGTITGGERVTPVMVEDGKVIIGFKGGT